MYWAFPPLVIWTASFYLKSRHRRTFYGGMAMATIVGIFAVYGLGILTEKKIDRIGHETWMMCFEDYMDREYPGWEYVEGPYQHAFMMHEPDKYRVAVNSVWIEFAGYEYSVFGQIRQQDMRDGWSGPTITIYPIDENGDWMFDWGSRIRWPNQELPLDG